ncbi:MAG TPA: TorF family putative porin [Wenzhouxiangella sp.]|nr:TorF family putative porin [Wenzhouxiangella sp.]
MIKTSSLLAASAAMAAGALVLAPAESAKAEVSANIGVVSNYFFRGFSETDGGAAVQGGLDYEADSGFYAGTWVSNVDFGDSTSYEMDLYLGFGGDLAEGVGYDVGYIYYAYPDAPGSADFGEIYGELSFGLFAVGAAYTVNDSSASVLESGDMYYYASVGFDLTEDYSLGFLVGRSAFDDSANDDFTHYQGSLAKATEAMGEFSFNLEYGNTRNDDLKAWVGWSLGF